MVKIRKNKKGDKYIIIEKEKNGLHISVHKSGHVHVKSDKLGIHSDVKSETVRKFLLHPQTEPLILDHTLKTTPCDKYPECICVHLEMNPQLIESGEYGKLCIKLKKLIGGGPCPEYGGTFCMWAGFCRRGIDPTPYVKML
jgi:hypothetical protein